MSRNDTNALGLWGEAQVSEYLKIRGARILDTRWRCPFGELDLVAEWEGFLCFVEVKLRKNDHFAPARAFVTGQKQEKLRQTAQLYLQENPAKLQPRFDVAEIYAPSGMQTIKPSIIYWKNAF